MEAAFDVNMFDMAIKAAGILFSPERLFFLAVGVVLGLIIGVIPGLGGLVGLSLLIPFTFDMDTYAALGVMMGLASVTMTVKFDVPTVVGVPLMTPVDALMAIPAGNVPALIDHA